MFSSTNNAFHLLRTQHKLNTAPPFLFLCRGSKDTKVYIEWNSFLFILLTKLPTTPCFLYALCPTGDCIAKETDC